MPLRRKLAICVAEQPDGITVLLPDGTQQRVSGAELPKEAKENEQVRTAGLRSQAARLLWWTAQETHGALPWPASQLAQYLTSWARTDPAQARLLAIDTLAVGRADLLDGFGLTATEVGWLRLVDAARRHDVPAVVEAAGALPPERYPAKIATLAAFADDVARVPDAAARLAPALAAHGDEPLSAVLQRKLGLAAAEPGDAMADLRLCAELFAVPSKVSDLLWYREGAARLHGPRGRLGFARAAGDDVTPEVDGAALRNAPLTIVDDLVDRDLVTPEAVLASGRSAHEQAYLVGRIAPDQLTAEQLADLGHGEETARRAYAASDYDAVDAAPDTPMSRHLRSLLAWQRNRCQDVDPDAALPGFEDAMQELARLDGAALDRPLPDVVVTDLSAWRPLALVLGAANLIRIPGLAERHPRFFEWLCLHAAREHLYLADWQGAVSTARRCLDVAVDEAIRDEAQNMLACGLLNLGDHLGALRELEAAIEGDYSVALLANIGVVAGSLDGELAARHLARIVREAPTLAMRANAALRALEMWQADAKIWQGADAGEELPVVLREPLRSIVAQPIGLDRFRQITRVLAARDPLWLRQPSSLASSPHRETLEARYAIARSWVGDDDGGFGPMLKLFDETEWRAAPAWFVDERDAFVEQTKSYVIDHIDDADNIGGLAFELSQRSGLEPQARLELGLLATAALAYGLTEQEAEVSELVVTTYHQSVADLGKLAGPVAESLAPMAELAGRRLALNHHHARMRDVNALVGTYNQAIDLLMRCERGSQAWFAARHVVAEMGDACLRARDQLLPWSRVVDHADLRGELLDFLDEVRELEFKTQRVLGN